MHGPSSSLVLATTGSLISKTIHRGCQGFQRPEPLDYCQYLYRGKWKSLSPGSASLTHSCMFAFCHSAHPFASSGHGSGWKILGRSNYGKKSTHELLWRTVNVSRWGPSSSHTPWLTVKGSLLRWSGWSPAPHTPSVAALPFSHQTYGEKPKSGRHQEPAVTTSCPLPPTLELLRSQTGKLGKRALSDPSSCDRTENSTTGLREGSEPQKQWTVAFPPVPPAPKENH